MNRSHHVVGLVLLAAACMVATAARIPSTFRQQQLRRHKLTPSTHLSSAAYQQWSGRIVGGETVDAASDYPYQVSLRDVVFTDFHFCGGTIIRANWILTAAHCISADEPEDMIVVVGTHRISEGGRFYNVSALIVHENFNNNTLENDIGLMRIDETMVFTPYVQPISLGNGSHVGAGRLGVVTGWGDLEVSDFGR